MAPARPLGRLDADLHDDRRGRPARVAARVPAQPRARRGVPGRSADAVGRRLPHRGRAGRARRPRAAGRVPPRCASTASTARADIVIETTRPELLPACVALVAHPDDERYQPVRQRGAHAAVRRARSRCVAHPLADPEKGTGIAMICTFGDITDVVWWRELQLPTRSVIGRDGRLVPDPPDWEATRSRRRARGTRELGGQERQAGAEARSSSCCATPGELDGEPAPITHPVKFYERGDRPLEIVTTRQWYFRNGGRDPELRAALLERGRELRWHPAAHAARATTPGSRASTATGSSAASGSSACRSRSGTRSTPTARSTTTTRSLARRGRAAGRPVERRARRVRRRPAGQARRVRRRSRRDGHVGDVVAHAADRTRLGRRPRPVRAHVPDGPAAAGPARSSARGCSPRSCARTSSTARCRGPTRRSTAGCSTPTARRCRSRRATSSRRSALRAVRPRRGALLGAERPARRRHRGRRRPDEGRPAARDQDPQRVEVRARRRSATTPPARRHRAARPVDARRARRSVDDATARVRGFDYARALERTERFFWGFCDDYVELVKQRAYGAVGERRRRLGPRDARARALDAAAAVRAALPFVTEEVWSWWQEGSVHRAPWPDATELGAAAGDSATLRLRGRGRGARRGPQGEDRSSSGRCAPSRRRRRARHRRAARTRSTRRSSDVREAGESARSRRRAGRRVRASRSSSPEDPRPDLDIGDRPGLARRARQPRDRRRRPGRRGPARDAPTLDRIRALVELLGSPQLEYPVIHLTGTNGKTSATRMTTALLDASGSRSAVHEPAPRAGQRAHRLERRADRRRRRSTRLLSGIADIEAHLPDPPSYFEILTAAAFGGSPTSRSTSPWSRSASAARGTRPTSSTVRSRSSPT